MRKQIAKARAENPGLDCAATTVERAAPEPEPAPTPAAEPEPAPATTPVGPDPAAVRRARTLVIAGSVTTGLGGLMLGVLTGGLVIGRKAEQDGDALTLQALAAGAPLSQDDPELQALVRRGRTGNQLAIAGGVIATVALAAGVTMLVLGLRKRKRLRAALVPGAAGLTLRF